MQQSNKRTIKQLDNRGTTLLELVVSIAIFSSMMLAVMTIFANVNTTQREAISSQNIQESVRFFMEMMSKEIRMAKGDKDGYLTGTCNDPLNLVDTNKKTYNFNDTTAYLGDTDNVLYFINKDNACVYYRLSANGRIMVSRYDGTDTFDLPVTSKNLLISNLKFKVADGDAGVVRTFQSKVTISFDVESTIDIEKHKNKMKMQTTVSSRRYE